jgi:hypothetical protein
MEVSNNFRADLKEFALKNKDIIDNRFFFLVNNGNIKDAVELIKELAGYHPTEHELEKAAEVQTADDIQKKFAVAKEASRLYMKYLSEL